MMKKLLFFTAFIIFLTQSIFASALTIEYDGITTEYTGSVYELHVNGKKLSLPLSPIIFNDRALVPVREVFEALDATVTYHEKTKCVEVEYNGNNISLYINNPAAYINGKKTYIPDNAVPKLINEVGEDAKTMVPVRFISENLDMTVDFQDPIIYISNDAAPPSPSPTATATPKPPASTATTPKPSASATASPSTTTAKLSNITYYDSGNGVLTTKATLTGTPGNVNAFVLSNPTRLVVDIYSCNYVVDTLYEVDINGIEKIRVGYENGRTRLVFDVENISSAAVKVKNKTLTILIGSIGTATTKVTIDTSEQSATATQAPTPSATQSPANITKIPYAEHEDSEKLIVIDAGHGGKDGGAQGTLNGKTIAEKTLTLKIATKTAEILTSKGYTVKMTRETDEYPTLQARADFANNSNAAVFVSIHINSAASAPTASGTETYYAPLNNDTSYRLKSSYLATYIQDYLISNLGSNDRGVKQSNHLVTRSSLMPSALVEVGFISNENELEKMNSDSYQKKTAESIAAGIIKALPKIEIPLNRDELMEERLQALNEWENTQ